MASGPSVMVRVLGDITGLGKSMDDTSAKGAGAASHLHAAFSGVLNTLNQTGVLGPFGSVLESAAGGLEKIAEHGKEIGPALLGAGATVTGIGVALQEMGSKDAAAHQQLQAAVEATGHSYEQYGGKVEEAIKHQEKYGHSASDTQDALRALTQATGDPAKALDDLSTATDLAAAKHESLTTASQQLAKASQGSAKILKEFGLTAKDAGGHTKTSTEIVGELSTKLQGQASAAASTFSGKIKGISTAVEDQVSVFAQKYGPAITAAGAVMTGLGATMEVAKGAANAFKTAQAAVKAATEGSTVAQWLFNAAMAANPVMIIVVAIAALIAIVILAYAKVTWFRDAVDDMGKVAAAGFNVVLNAAKFVWQWLSANWPLLLAILLGPFAVLALEIVKHRDSILKTIGEIPGKINAIASGMWDGILHAFKAMINGIIDAWNSLQFKTPSVDILGKHIGGETIGVPRIPHLAEGGLITQTGLIYAHAGEAITPAAAVGRTAPAVHIEHAEFSSDVDVTAFMKRAAFVVQAAGV